MERKTYVLDMKQKDKAIRKKQSWANLCGCWTKKDRSVVRILYCPEWGF